MGRLIEGVWDCRYCDSHKIRGSIRVCPVCGRQRDDNIKFYIDNPHDYVDDEKAKTINRNPDWICSYCEALNSDDVQTCHICEASREDSEKNYFERQAELAAREAEKNRIISDTQSIDRMRRQQEFVQAMESFHDDQRKKANKLKEGPIEVKSDPGNAYTPPDDDNFDRYPHVDKKSNKSSAKRKELGGIFKIGAGILAAILIIFLIGLAVTPKIQDVTIQDFSWERSINIEEYVTVQRDGWSLPSDGRLLRTDQEIKRYEQVLDHYETKTRQYTEQVLDHYETYVSGYRDLGNGYFEEITSQRPVYRTETRTETYQEPVYRDEPIYATKYYYEIDVWQYAFSYSTSGNDKEPYWKDFELEDLQREGERNETYYVEVVNEDGETNKYKFDFETWNSLEKGETVSIKTTIFGDAELYVED